MMESFNTAILDYIDYRDYDEKFKITIQIFVIKFNFVTRESRNKLYNTVVYVC